MVRRCSILSVGYRKECFAPVNKTCRLGPFRSSGLEKLRFQTLKSIQSYAFQASVLLTGDLKHSFPFPCTRFALLLCPLAVHCGSLSKKRITESMLTEQPCAALQLGINSNLERGSRMLELPSVSSCFTAGSELKTKQMSTNHVFKQNKNTKLLALVRACKAKHGCACCGLRGCRPVGPMRPQGIKNREGRKSQVTVEPRDRT